jgi:multiple sugar transport system ATP-binding protein
MAKVVMEGVRKIYEDRGKTHVAVHGIDLAVADGEFLVLVGPSGCGKSTTLRMVAGLETISAGTLRIGDRVVNEVAARDRNIAMVFQNYALYPHMSVGENLGFALQLKGINKTERERRVRETAALLEIEDLLQRRPKQLSGGQRQRVAVGRAMIRQPDVFLFDEPLSNLDAKLRVQMRRELGALRRRLATTTLYATHDQTEAMTLGDRIVVMRDGIVQQVDTPLVIYGKPANTFVATFMGSPPMNLIRGRPVAEPHPRFQVTDDSVTFAMESGTWLGNTPAREDVLLGVRPEGVRVNPTSNNGVSGVVEEIEPLGGETLLFLKVGTVGLTAKVSGNQAVRRGETVGVELDESALHWFDAATEMRLPGS